MKLKQLLEDGEGVAPSVSAPSQGTTSADIAGYTEPLGMVRRKRLYDDDELEESFKNINTLKKEKQMKFKDFLNEEYLPKKGDIVVGFQEGRASSKSLFFMIQKDVVSKTGFLILKRVERLGVGKFADTDEKTIKVSLRKNGSRDELLIYCDATSPYYISSFVNYTEDRDRKGYYGDTPYDPRMD